MTKQRIGEIIGLLKLQKRVLRVLREHGVEMKLASGRYMFTPGLSFFERKTVLNKLAVERGRGVRWGVAGMARR